MGGWTREKFDDAVEKAKRSAEKALKENGKTDVMLSTAFILGNVNPETKAIGPFAMVVGFMDSDPEAKAKNTTFLRNLCRDLDAEGFVIALETWVREYMPDRIRESFPNAPTDEKALNTWIVNNWVKVKETIPPAEAVMIVAHYHQHVEQHMLHFTRAKDGQPVLGEWEKSDKSQIDHCRFADLLPGSGGN